MTDLYDLAQTQQNDDEVSFEILPADARLSISGRTAELVHLFGRIVSVVPTKAVVAGTEWMQLSAHSANGGRLNLVRASASDGEVTVSVGTDKLEVKREGSVLLPAKRVYDILRVAPTKEVVLTVLGDTATITAGRARWTVQTPAGEAIPPLPDLSDVSMHPVPRDELLRALRIVRLAVSAATSRAALQQALIRNQTITGSDAGRVHRARVASLPADLDTTIPARFIDELIRALDENKDPQIHLGAGDLYVVANVGDDHLVCQRFMLGYPDVEPVIQSPQFENQERFHVEPLPLIEVIKRVRVNADADQGNVFLDLAPGSTAGEWNLIVWTRDRAGNTAKEVVPTTWVGGKKPRTFSVSAKQLIELLAATREPSVEIRVGPDTKTKRFPLLVEAETFIGVLQQQMVL